MTYYQSTSNDADWPVLDQTIHCDVCVIGAGYAGLATAAGLIERGHQQVVVLEAEQVGAGASGRNGGFVFGGFSLSNQALTRQLGQQRASHLFQLTQDAVQLIRQRIDQYQIDCDKVESGVVLANWFNDDQVLLRQQEFMRKQFNVDWTLWSREQTRDQLQSDRYFGALHETNAFHFHPLNYARGLARTLEARGLKLFERSRVTRIESGGPEKIVHTARATVRARHVVVCCGGYIEQLQRRLARSVLPITTFVMSTEPLGDRLRTALRSDAAIYDTRFAFDYYRPLPDTRLLWGGRISIFNPSPAEIARKLYADMVRVYPQLDGVKVEQAWSGLMSYARHQMPQIGQLEDGLWYAMGFGGHGISTTTLAGEVVASAIRDNKPLPGGLEHYGLPRVYGAAGLLAAQLTYWYYELRDRWNEC
jgi:gamma-glutamylputrescine oxidase